MRVFFTTLAASLLLPLSTLADGDFQLSLVPKIQIVNKSESVTAFRLGFWSENANMIGLDLNVAGITRGDFGGLGLGVVNVVEGNGKGVQLGLWGVNMVGGNFVGWNSAAFFNRTAGDFVGLQGSAVCITNGNFSGWQAGWIYTHTGGQISGVQTGIVNHAASVHGLQLGIVNIAHDMKGLQIGIANVITNSSLPFMVIVNGKF